MNSATQHEDRLVPDDLPVPPTPFGTSGIGTWLRHIKLRQVLSIPIWLAAVFALVASDVIPSFVPASRVMLSSQIGTMLTVAAVVLIVIAARLGVSTAWQIGAADPGSAPVLYLRSFKSDRTPIGSASDEDLLSRLFSTLGPFIAIDEPGSLVPDIGAAKLQADHDEWKSVVADRIDHAQAVVLHIGDTPGFLWEIEQVVKRCDPRRIVLYFSLFMKEGDLEEQFENLKEKAEVLFPRGLPEVGPHRIITFDSDWTPTTQRIETPSRFWMWVLGILSLPMLGLPLLMFRPLTAMTRSRLIGWRLSGFPQQIGYRPLDRPAVSRFAVAFVGFLVGLIPAIAMLMYNAWASGRWRRVAGFGVAGTIAIWPPVREVAELSTTLLAVAIVMGWPLLASHDVRRHLAFYGKSVGFPVGSAAIVVGVLLIMFLPPPGIPLPVAEHDRGAYLTLSSFTEPSERTSERTAQLEKTGKLNGTTELYYFESDDYSSIEVVNRFNTDIFGQEIGSYILGDDPISEFGISETRLIGRGGSRSFSRWDIRLYEVIEENLVVAYAYLAQKRPRIILIVASGAITEPGILEPVVLRFLGGEPGVKIWIDPSEYF